MNSIQNHYDERFQPDGLSLCADFTHDSGSSFNGQRDGNERREDESDCSWTHEEDNGTFYIDIRRRLEHFLNTPDQTTMTIPMLSRHHRRFVHASAQVMGLGHASLGAQGKYRRMIVFKDDTFLLRISSLSQQQSEDINDPLLSEQFPLPESLPRKRRRQSRVDGGFPCHFSGCKKIFDRASERTKHEQSHQRTFTTRYQCPQCEKGFRYPKDLRRHQKVHEKAIETNLVFNDASLPSSILASESRVSSETSLTFSNKTFSKDNSPRVEAWVGEERWDFEMDPLVLDLDSWGISDAHFIQDHGFQAQDLNECVFEEDGFDDGFLEMAKSKK